jgi:hypothetical protein
VNPEELGMIMIHRNRPGNLEVGPAGEGDEASYDEEKLNSLLP